MDLIPNFRNFWMDHVFDSKYAKLLDGFDSKYSKLSDPKKILKKSLVLSSVEEKSQE